MCINTVRIAILSLMATSCALLASAAEPEIRGPFPILSVPYRTDGAVDHDVLVKEARFVADAGVNGFIWCQSNDAVDLLSVEEKKASFGVLARAFEGEDVFVTLGCQGRDTDEMLELATEVERLAVPQLVAETRRAQLRQRDVLGVGTADEAEGLEQPEIKGLLGRV